MPYWRDREEANQRLYLLEDDDYVDRLQDIYDYMQDQIQREINGFYTKYLTTEGITYAEATKRVSQLDIDEYQRKAKEYVANRDFSAQANSEMRLYNTTMKINRLELLKSEIGLELVNGFMVIDDEMKAGLTDRAIEEFTRQAGILGKTVINVSEAANSIVNASFRHATFSDRIWMYQDQLKAELDMLLRQGLIQGWNPNEMARHLDKLFDTGKYNCERLMRTELTRVQSDAQLQSFSANGFEWYQFNALGDACPACALLDEQHFRVADAMPGENLPPIHPNCRCAVSAWMDDALYREWLDSYANHGMSYEDWLNNRPASLLDQILAEDAGRDYKQMLDWYNDFDRGEMVPGWFDDDRLIPAYIRAEGDWADYVSRNVTDEEDWQAHAGYIRTTRSYYLNNAMRENPDKSLDLMLMDKDITERQYEVAEALDSIIAKNQLKSDTILSRYLTDNAIQDIFGIDSSIFNDFKYHATDPNALFSDLIGGIVQENGYISASGNKTLNYFFDRRYNRIDIYAPSGTNAYVTDNFEESEVIFARGTKYIITGFDIDYDEEIGGYFVIKVRIVQ